MVLLLLVILVVIIHYRYVVQGLWRVAQEPFKPVSKADLKWRLRSRWRSLGVTLELKYPHTWETGLLITRVVKRVGGKA